MPRLSVTKAYTQQQGRDGKAANPEQSGDAVGEIKNGSHGLAMPATISQVLRDGWLRHMEWLR